MLWKILGNDEGKWIENSVHREEFIITGHKHPTYLSKGKIIKVLIIILKKI